MSVLINRTTFVPIDFFTLPSQPLPMFSLIFSIAGGIANICVVFWIGHRAYEWYKDGATTDAQIGRYLSIFINTMAFGLNVFSGINLYTVDTDPINIARNWFYNLMSLGVICTHLQVLTIFRPIAKVSFIKPNRINVYRGGLALGNFTFCGLMYWDYIAFDHHSMSTSLFWVQFVTFFLWCVSVYTADGLISIFLILKIQKHRLTFANDKDGEDIRNKCMFIV